MSFIQQISYLTTVQYPPLSLIKWEIESFTDSPAVLLLNIEVYICLAVYVYKKNYLANLSQCLTISTLATNLPYNISILHMLTYIFCGFYIYLVNFFNIWGGSVEFMIMYHESFMEGFGKWYSMLIYWLNPPGFTWYYHSPALARARALALAQKV